MLSLAQALERRGAAGTPLPAVYPGLAAAGIDICRSQLSLITGPPAAGKSMLAFNLIAKMQVPALAFLLDTNELTASCRFLSIITGDDYKQIKTAIISGDYKGQKVTLAEELPFVRVVFHAPTPEDVEREVKAFEQRYGLPPDVVLVDNLGNQASAYENEWQMLKALTLEMDSLARRAQCAVIATAHTTDLDSCEPAQRTKILGKISQYPRLILSVGYNKMTGEFKVAAVKNTEGETDVKAEHPLVLYAEPARMQLSETPLRHPQVQHQQAYIAPWSGN
jgi:hypothetical protein